MIDIVFVVLIIGSVCWIGVVIVCQFYVCGWLVVLYVYIFIVELQQMVFDLDMLCFGSVLVLQVDLCDVDVLFDLVEQIVVQFGWFDVLVNNVFNFYFILFGQIIVEYWDDLFVVNVCVLLLLVQVVVLQLCCYQGSIVNLIDLYGIQLMCDYLVYSVVKVVLEMVIWLLVLELVFKVWVNVVVFGVIFWFEQGKDDFVQQVLLVCMLLVCIGIVEEIVEVVYWLVSDVLFIIGYILCVDGGCQFI